MLCLVDGTQRSEGAPGRVWSAMSAVLPAWTRPTGGCVRLWGKALREACRRQSDEAELDEELDEELDDEAEDAPESELDAFEVDAFEVDDSEVDDSEPDDSELDDAPDVDALEVDFERESFL